MLPADDKEIYALIGQRIRVRRALMGISEKRLAEAANISLYKLRRYEAGDGEIRASTLHQIAKKLGVPFGYFFETVAPSALKMSASPSSGKLPPTNDGEF